MNCKGNFLLSSHTSPFCESGLILFLPVRKVDVFGLQLGRLYYSCFGHIHHAGVCSKDSGVCSETRRVPRQAEAAFANL